MVRLRIDGIAATERVHDRHGPSRPCRCRTHARARAPRTRRRERARRRPAFGTAGTRCASCTRALGNAAPRRSSAQSRRTLRQGTARCPSRWHRDRSPCPVGFGSASPPPWGRHDRRGPCEDRAPRRAALINPSPFRRHGDLAPRLLVLRHDHAAGKGQPGRWGKACPDARASSRPRSQAHGTTSFMPRHPLPDHGQNQLLLPSITSVPHRNDAAR